MKSLTTGSATSASSSARRTSRSASWMLASVSRASPRSVLTTRDKPFGQVVEHGIRSRSACARHGACGAAVNWCVACACRAARRTRADDFTPRRRRRACTRWPRGRVAGARDAPAPCRARRRCDAGCLALALACTRSRSPARSSRPTGSTSRFANALSLVAGLVVLVAWASGAAAHAARRRRRRAAGRRGRARCCRRSSRSRTGSPTPSEPWAAAAHRRRARRLRAVHRRRAAGAGADRASRSGCIAACRDAGTRGVPPLLTLERFLFRLRRRRLRAADADARERHPLLRAAVRQAADVHAQERVLGRSAGSRSARCSSAAGATAGAAASRCAGSSPARCCWSSPTSAASSCSKCSCAADEPRSTASRRRILTSDHRGRLDDIPLRTLGDRARRAAGDRRLLLDRRDGDDGGQPLPAEAPRAARRARRASSRSRCSAQTDKLLGVILLGNTLVAAARRDADRGDHQAPVRRRRARAGARHGRDLVRAPRVLRDHAEGGRRGARRPHRAARRATCWRRCCGALRRSSGSSTCSCRGCCKLLRIQPGRDAEHDADAGGAALAGARGRSTSAASTGRCSPTCSTSRRSPSTT